MKQFHSSSGGAEEKRWKECSSSGAQRASELWKVLKRRCQAAKNGPTGKTYCGAWRSRCAAVLKLSLKRPKTGVFVWRMRAGRDTWRNSSQKKRASEKGSLKEAAGPEMSSLTSLTTGSQELHGGFDNKRAEGDTPGKFQPPETGGEQEPAGHRRSRWGNRSASGKMLSQRFLWVWFL